MLATSLDCQILTALMFVCGAEGQRVRPSPPRAIAKIRSRPSGTLKRMPVEARLSVAVGTSQHPMPNDSLAQYGSADESRKHQTYEKDTNPEWRSTDWN